MEKKPLVIYEDKNFIAVNKPAGLLVHETKVSKGKNEKTLALWLIEKYPEIKKVGDAPELRPGIVHRLDKDTSGVLIVARTQSFFDYLKKLFQEHKVMKKYLVLVFGKLQGKGIINKPIGLRTGTIKRGVRIKKAKMVKSAITEYKSLKVLRDKEGNFFTLLEARPKTGRTHQIRVHLASLGHPVVGDNLYGAGRINFVAPRQFLHAESIEFSLENGRRIRIEAEIPEELERVLDNLKS